MAVFQGFLGRVLEKIRPDEQVVGLAAGGSYSEGTMDGFSDLDLVLVTSDKVAPDAVRMKAYAESFGGLLNAFTGEHVGENRLLICLYESPLLHVDIKFVTTEEFSDRVEDPVILWERGHALSDILKNSTPHYPYPSYQWIEDRFWTWIHYAALKIGRGEIFEAMDFTAYLRVMVISQLLQIRNGQLPRSLRKVEFHFSTADLAALRQTVAGCEKASVVAAIDRMIALYRELRDELYPVEIQRRTRAEEQCVAYYEAVKHRP